MSAEQSLKIVSFGLIGEGENGNRYRNIVFRDTVSGKETDFIVYKKKRPVLWSDIEEMEKGKAMPPYRGKITRYQGIDLVIFGEDSPEEALEEQIWKLDLVKRISYTEAEKMRNESQGYSTDLTRKGCLEMAWTEINKAATRIRYRYYQGEGIFNWSIWYELKGH